MKLLVAGLSGVVRRLPWVVIAFTIVVTFVMSSFSNKFLPETDSNDSFAPDAPELAAVDRIAELYGEESSVGVMQVIVTAPEGSDLFTMAGYQTVQAISESVASGPLAEYLVQDPQQPPILSYLAPVEFAIAGGAPVPATDEELRTAYLDAVAQLPSDQVGLTSQLLGAASDAEAPTGDKGLVLLFHTAGARLEIEEFTDLSAEVADDIEGLTLSDGFTAEPFSFELLFADEDEFQTEILRLFATAALIILLVLALVFLVAPTRNRNKWIVRVGVVAMIGATVISILPTLATVLDSAFPDAWKDWNSNLLLASVALIVVATFVVWSIASKRLRRTVADTAITFVTIIIAIQWMNGLGYLLFTDASPMTQILPILLIGLGVDYSIHVTTRYRDEIAGGADVDTAVATAVRTVGVALVLATITTAVGFLTNLFNDLPALREFGLLAAAGIFFSFVLMLSFVPAIRELLDRRAQRNGNLDREGLIGAESKSLPRLIGGTAGLASRAAVPTIVVALVLGVIGGYGVTKLETKFSFIDFIPTTSPLRQTFETLLTDFGGGFGENTQVLIEGDVSTAGAWNAMVQANANLVDTADVVTFAGQPAATSPVSVIGPMVTPDAATFDEGVAAALRDAGATDGLMVSEGADVSAVYEAAYAAAPDAMSGVVHGSEAGYDSALFDITTQAGEAGAGRLRTNSLDDFVPVSDAGLSVVVTSDEIIGDVVVTTLRNSQVSSLLLTLVAALVLLVANFWYEARRPMLGVITTLPVVLVVVLSFTLMVLFGIPFGPITATIAALAVGIGIPYMIHITHRYLEERVRYESAADAIRSTLTHTGGALAGSAVTTIAGFGILVTSTTIPFRQFGFVTAYTILLALLAAVLVLPAMLFAWDRWHRTRGESVFEAAAEGSST